MILNVIRYHLKNSLGCFCIHRDRVLGTMRLESAGPPTYILNLERANLKHDYGLPRTTVFPILEAVYLPFEGALCLRY